MLNAVYLVTCVILATLSAENTTTILFIFSLVRGLGLLLKIKIKLIKKNDPDYSRPL